MNIDIQQHGNVYKIDLDGRLDTAGAGAIDAAFSAHCASKPNVIVDLGKVPFIASIGIRLLVAGAQAQSKIGGKMVLMKPDEMARRILKTTGIERLMPIHETLQDAIAAFPAK
ncbi:MAG: STAS domain-containing protein [Betaproteobacteria bacterium]|nr:STAS domain-containing protein [Betaproteobacteria bacterium]